MSTAYMYFESMLIIFLIVHKRTQIVAAIKAFGHTVSNNTVL